MSNPDEPSTSLDLHRSGRPTSLADVLPAAPGILRVAASSAMRVATWSVATSVDMTTQTFKALAAGQSPVAVGTRQPQPHPGRGEGRPRNQPAVGERARTPPALDRR
jgi:hypothetical protein